MAFSTCINQGRRQGGARRGLGNSEWKMEHCFLNVGSNSIHLPLFDAQEIVGGFKPQEFPGGFGDSSWAACAVGVCCKAISAPTALPAPHTHTLHLWWQKPECIALKGSKNPLFFYNNISTGQAIDGWIRGKHTSLLPSNRLQICKTKSF